MNKDLTLHYQKLAFIRLLQVEILTDIVDFFSSYDMPNDERLKALENQEKIYIKLIVEIENEQN